MCSGNWVKATPSLQVECRVEAFCMFFAFRCFLRLGFVGVLEGIGIFEIRRATFLALC